MRILIGAVCIAVLTYVGYFFWGEYQQSQARAQYAIAKERQTYEDSCWRIISTSPKYDKEYSKTLSSDETISRLKKCSVFFETGKLP